ncbi:MAG: Vms1/Ankzf1 family peptidyl-tRNA hydrolase, partial [Nocardioides sp.]
AAADHAVRLLGDLAGPVVTGGDSSALEAVLEDPRLRALEVLERRLPVPDPRRAVLEQAVADACSVGVVVHNSDGPSWPGRPAEGAGDR